MIQLCSCIYIYFFYKFKILRAPFGSLCIFLLRSYIVLRITFRIYLPYQTTYTKVHFCNCGQANVVDEFPAGHAAFHYNSYKQLMQPWCTLHHSGTVRSSRATMAYIYKSCLWLNVTLLMPYVNNSTTG